MRIASGSWAKAGGIAWALSFVASRLLLEQPDLDVGVRALLAFGPTLPFVVFLIGAIGLLRETDEMERRIQVEGLATAFGLVMILVATLALAQRAGFASDEDFSFVHLIPMMLVFYLGGTVIARRRYTCETE
jgi:multisubunit Na+/H+ antiporter MnhG subunit